MMRLMQGSAVISMDEARARARRVTRAIDVRRQLSDVPRRRKLRSGRAWLNGVELGDAYRGRFAHLAESYD
jgi:hypothetical protein